MTIEAPQAGPQRSPLHVLARKNVLAGLMFMGIGALGLWLSRNYPIGTALRMGTGYVPRLLCWMLLGLGAVVLIQGVREKETLRTPQPPALAQLWPVLVMTASLVIFALSIEQLGLVLSILLLVAIGSLAARGIKLWEALAAAVGLIVLSWAIFIFGLGLTIPVWPDF
jgi:putative tricarboxylic transport membrane protein